MLCVLFVVILLFLLFPIQFGKNTFFLVNSICHVYCWSPKILTTQNEALIHVLLILYLFLDGLRRISNFLGLSCSMRSIFIELYEIYILRYIKENPLGH